MRNILKVFAGLLIVVYVILFAWANRGTTHIYYWPAKDMIIPLLGYQSSDETVSYGGAPVDSATAAESAVDSSLTAAGEAAGSRAPRPVPVFLPILIAFVGGFLLCWAVSTSMVVREKRAARKARKELRSLQDQFDAVQKIDLPEEPSMAAAPTGSGDGAKSA